MNFKLFEARRKAGLTQNQLGEKAGLSGAIISHIELGKAEGNRKTRALIAHALRMPVSQLFENEGEDEKHENE